MSQEEQTTIAQADTLCDRREELTEYLRSRLIECGWRDQVTNMCRNMIQKHGVEQIKFAHIINEVQPEAKRKVPDQVKNDLLVMIRKFNQETADTKE